GLAEVRNHAVDVVYAVMNHPEAAAGEPRIAAALLLRRAFEQRDARALLGRRKRGAKGGIAATDDDDIGSCHVIFQSGAHNDYSSTAIFAQIETCRGGFKRALSRQARCITSRPCLSRQGGFESPISSRSLVSVWPHLSSVPVGKFSRIRPAVPTPGT